ncbi:hypothetical protein CAI21_03075 [Alkalilimnicola ehrlichii]|uniref:Uncharacterized protein n=1 Tax=Alkalilimnicola ehrlichii TaxID=351052 RepID=A0A3E0X2U9_9GAMM|nr:hypothetical protein [Alkalilimnicola ehrlichii]RFA30972.1 hypothetical protein CAI21_03075 [Alkalilimnicola ehrlichii]RFA38923.1 hypothetical protein CAL65_03220 [Alkalilimnicola ehrlichii]
MRRQIAANIIVSLLLLAVPLVALYATAGPEHVDGIGFGILLYEPFDFAYVLLAWVLFFGVNFWSFVARGRSSKQAGVAAVVTSGLIVLVWFIVAFLAVAQLHISLGGQL